jgi:hypothetical protein
MVNEIGNYVTMGPGETKTMRFDKAVWTTIKRKDPRTGITSDVNALEFHVVELDSQTVDTKFSTISQQLQNALQAYIDQGKLTRYRFTITKGAGRYDAPRIAAAVPL